MDTSIAIGVRRLRMWACQVLRRGDLRGDNDGAECSTAEHAWSRNGEGGHTLRAHVL